MGLYFPSQNEDQRCKQISLLHRGTFSNVLGRVIWKTFSGDKPPDPQVSLDDADANICSHHFHTSLTRLAQD